MLAEMTSSNFAKHTQFDPAKTVQGSSFSAYLEYVHRKSMVQSADIEDQLEEARERIVAAMRDWGYVYLGSISHAALRSGPVDISEGQGSQGSVASTLEGNPLEAVRAFVPWGSWVSTVEDHQLRLEDTEPQMDLREQEDAANEVIKDANALSREEARCDVCGKLGDTVEWRTLDFRCTCGAHGSRVTQCH